MARDAYETTAMVQALSPIHIGTGDVLNPLSYIYTGDEVRVIDEALLMEWLGTNPSAASRFITAAETRQSIGDFLRAERVRFEGFTRYTLAAKITRAPTDIRPFIKTIDSRPYLPGSSLKGCLRSALLRGVVLADPERAEDFAEIVEESAERRRTGSEEIEASVFVQPGVKRQRYSNYDLNRALVVSDSAPRKVDRLEIVEARMLSLQTNGRMEYKRQGNTPVPIFIEAIQPMTKFQMLLRRDMRLLRGDLAARELGLNDPDRSRLMIHLTRYCRAAGLEIIAQEINFYRRHGQGILAGWFEEKRDYLRINEGLFALPIGWGSGYDAKTITDLLPEETYEEVTESFRNTRGLGRPGNAPSSPWLGPEDSPKSRKVVERSDGSIEPVGWVLIQLAPGTDGEDWDSLQSHVSAPEIDEAQFFQTVRAAPATKNPPEAKPQPAEKSQPEPNTQSAGKPTPEPEPSQRTEPAPASPPASPHLVGSDGFIIQFRRKPQPGEQFRGIAAGFIAGQLLIDLPGLDMDEEAVGWIEAKDLPAGRARPQEGDVIACRVVDTQPDPKTPDLLMVQCEIVL